MGRLPVENGLPAYVSKHSKSKILRYFRRPPTGVEGSAFIRSFKTKDRKVMLLKYGPVHAEAEEYFARLISGRTLSDQEIEAMASSMFVAIRKHGSEAINSTADLDTFIANHGNDQIKALVGPDRLRLHSDLELLYRHSERVDLEILKIPVDAKADYIASRFGKPAVPPPTTGGLTLMGAYEQAWKPSSAKRSEGTIAETLRFVTDFITLNGDHNLIDLTRDHWAKWRANCLELHGPGWTALKRFSMVKTVVAEAISAGLFERNNHAGQDVTMKKPARSNLRNEGWSDDELKELFASDPFTVFDGKHRNAEYWVPTIIALTGARLSEVTGMNVPDVGRRHGVLTFFLARYEGKTEESRRIIPIPQKLIDLGLLRYIDTLNPKAPLFPTINSDIISKWFGRHRKSIGVDRKGADLHAMRHHMKTLLRNVGAPDVVSDYITGHAGDNVGSTYGKTELQTALDYMNKVDLGVTIPKWTA